MVYIRMRVYNVSVSLLITDSVYVYILNKLYVHVYSHASIE